ncbi:MAG: GNAT family N-acetyltransferase [Janthinobacterium lividum]
MQAAARQQKDRQKLCSGDSAELNLHKQLESPVVQLSKEEAVSAIKAMSPEAWQWNLAPTPFPPTSGDVNKNDSQSPKRTDQQIWNHRIMEVRGYLMIMFQNSKNYDAMSYRVDGKTVGVLLYAISAKALYIGYLVTHPGTEGAGGALIEAAVNLSRDLGKKGRVHLMVENQDAYKIYQHFGFRAEANGLNMTLDPEDSDGTWTEVSNNKLALSRHAGKHYIS